MLRIVSFNIHKGFSAGNRRFVLHDMKQAIEKRGADLVFLQEVQGNHEGHRARIRNWPAAAQFEFLADRMWPHTAYGKNAVYTEGHHGNAILSRFPFRSWENIDVSNSRYERRGILHGVVLVDAKESPGAADGVRARVPLHVLCVHLSLFETDRRRQIHTIGRRIREHVPRDEPIILAGDFNDWREYASPILQEEVGLREAFHSLEGRHARTFPAFLPSLRLDRVYSRGLELRGARTLLESPWDSLSDHVGLEVDFGAPTPDIQATFGRSRDFPG